MIRVLVYLQAAVLLASMSLVETKAFGVTPKQGQNKSSAGWVTTGAATRAHSDVQLRRLLSVFADKKLNVNQEDVFEQIQKLRKVQK